MDAPKALPPSVVERRPDVPSCWKMARQAANPSANDASLDEEAALRKIVEGVESETGEGFFRSLVRCVTEALGVSYSFVSELDAERRVFRTLAVWGHGQRLDNFELPIAGTPCEGVLRGEMAHHPEHVQALFPEDKGLATWEAESYCGVPLIDSAGIVLGHLAIFDTKPMHDPRGLAILRIFAARARAEVERVRAETRLRDNESRFRDLYEDAPIAYITIGIDGRVRSLNSQTLKVFGFTREQSIGHDFLEFLPAVARRQGAELFQRALGGSMIDDEEVEALRADGSTFWIRVSARPVPDTAGGIEAFRVTLVDVSARRRAEEALRESELRYRDLYEQAPVAYWYAGDGGRIAQANRAMAEMFGYARESIIGRTLYDFCADTPNGKPKALSVRQRFLAGTEIRGEEIEARRADGSPLWLRVSASPQRLASGIVTGGRVTAVDVTAEKRAEEAVRVSEYLEEEIRAAHNIDEIIGQSPALMAVLEKVRLVAATDSSVLILGETGTGKELVARAVHSASPRKHKPLIKVNCAALPSGLIESELFGHEKGAFTGANARRIGRFELADGGTIFLDEIGEVPPEVQVKLLRVLQEREIERVGGQKTIAVDVRVIAATNRDLKGATAVGRFREDLYYRLNVFPIEVPPLRDRPDDVPLLVHYFVARYGAKIGRRISRVPEATMRRFVEYPWPGNIRELENVIERAVILSVGPELNAMPDLPAAARAAVADHSPPAAAPGNGGVPLDEVERRHIVAVLKQSGWRIEGPTGAARLLNLNPSTLRSRMKKLGIQRSREESS
jgi:formate hydrogenlyase transcriptional activator